MAPVQFVLQFLAEVVAALAGPQTGQLAQAAHNIGFVLSAVPAAVNAVGAIRKLRTPKAPAALPAPGCCGACPTHCPQVRAE